MLAAREANLRVLTVSSKSDADGDMQTIINVRALPPRESYNDKEFHQSYQSNS